MQTSLKNAPGRNVMAPLLSIKRAAIVLFSVIPSVSFAYDDSCVNEQNPYEINLCFGNKLEALKQEHKKVRDGFVKTITSNIDEVKKFKSLEAVSHREWLSSIEKDCEMIAFKTGTEGSSLYNTGYLMCTLQKYNERISFLKSNQHF